MSAQASVVDYLLCLSIKDCLTFLRISSVPPKQRYVTEDPTENSYLRVPSVFVSRFCTVFVSVVFPCMDALLHPEYLLLLLEQGDKSLEDYTRLFRMLANTTSYLDDALCAFYDASLNTTCGAPSSEDGPREDFAAFVEWTLVRNGSPLASRRISFHSGRRDRRAIAARSDRGAGSDVSPGA